MKNYEMIYLLLLNGANPNLIDKFSFLIFIMLFINLEKKLDSNCFNEKFLRYF